MSQLEKYKKKGGKIFYNNYIFHYLVLTNNLKGLKLMKYPVYKLDNNGMNAFHLAAQNNYFEILQYLIKTYPDYVYNLSGDNSNFMSYIDFNIGNFFHIIKNNDLDWNVLLNRCDEEETCIDLIFNLSSKKVILEILNKTNVNLREYKNVPSFFNLLLNTKLSLKDKKILLEEIEKKYSDMYNLRIKKNGGNIIWESLKSGDFELIKFICNKMKQKKIKINQTMPVYGFNLFRTAYNSDKDKENYEISKYIWSQVKDDIDFTNTNMFLDNLAHFILSNRLERGMGDEKLELEILSKCNQWNIQNIEKNTPLHLLVEVKDGFKKLSKILKGKNLDLTIKNEDGKTVLDLASKKWKNYLLKLPKFKENENDSKLICGTCNYAHYNLFSASFMDISILLYNLDKKYKNLYIPKYLKNVIPNVNYENGLNLPDKFLEEYLNFPWMIFWERNGKYWLHPYLNQLINSVRREGSHDFAAIILSLKLAGGGLHATILIYDFKNNSIERFDPYGDTTLIDDNLDDVLEEELTWNTGLSYIRPNEYLPVSSFQMISNENNGYNQKSGDFGGYCAAWCLWYLESRIKNYKISQKELVSKLIKKLVKLDITFSEYIRNYANNINKLKIKTLKSLQIPKNRISDKNLFTKYENLIYDFIFENM